jgi:hypothetical protein
MQLIFRDRLLMQFAARVIISVTPCPSPPKSFNSHYTLCRPRTCQHLKRPHIIVLPFNCRAKKLSGQIMYNILNSVSIHARYTSRPCSEFCPTRNTSFKLCIREHPYKHVNKIADKFIHFKFTTSQSFSYILNAVTNKGTVGVH